VRPADPRRRPGPRLVHIAFNYVVRGGRRVRKDTKTHQDRWLAIDPVTCALIAGYLAEIKAKLAAVGHSGGGATTLRHYADPETGQVAGMA
jgi:hypothetical protein